MATLTKEILDQYAYYNWEPRPDRPEMMDQQSGFYHSKHPGVTALLGGNGAGTTTCGLAKMAKFICLEQAPPRRDTPFWIIAESYEQVCNACWKEKLHQQGHLPPNDIDWLRIDWYKRNQDWPFRVPMKPWAGRPGKNWQLVFKSYAQGRRQMQAESIGGFLFVEQFPWELLEEVMRGCREYSFVGNKLIEFTPVDPAMSIELREMEENDKLPKGWGLYRANTEAAVDAGHVSKQWFEDFYGMLPKAMIPVRTRGLWGNFEGAVYPEWNPLIHTVKSENHKIPPGSYHVRAVDFGFSLGHYFVCLWAYHDGKGNYTVYDEYASNDTSMTVVDHWKQIADRHYWPTNNPYYGVTYVDHDLDAIRTLMKINEYTQGEYDPPSTMLAKKDVMSGVEHVKYMLNNKVVIAPEMVDRDGNYTEAIVRPRVIVVRDRCPMLCKQMITYRYPKKTSTSVNAPTPADAPIKADDDSVDCFRYLLYSDAMMRGGMIETMAHEHSPGKVQVESAKFRRRHRPRRP